jgi:hypothetical protein
MEKQRRIRDSLGNTLMANSGEGLLSHQNASRRCHENDVKPGINNLAWKRRRKESYEFCGYLCACKIAGYNNAFPVETREIGERVTSYEVIAAVLPKGLRQLTAGSREPDHLVLTFGVSKGCTAVKVTGWPSIDNTTSPSNPIPRIGAVLALTIAGGSAV